SSSRSATTGTPSPPSRTPARPSVPGCAQASAARAVPQPAHGLPLPALPLGSLPFRLLAALRRLRLVAELRLAGLDVALDVGGRRDARLEALGQHRIEVHAQVV